MDRREQRTRYKAKLATDPERQARLKAASSLRACTKERDARRTPSGWVIYNLRKARRRAKVSGLEYALTPADITIPAACPVLGIPILLTAEGQRSPNSPSLDRKNPALGYVVGNVFVISWLANRLKSDCTNPTVMRRIADYVERPGS